MAPSLEIVRELIRIARQVGVEHELMIRLSATVATRRAELVGLRWPQIDLDAGLVTIDRGRVVVPGEKPGVPLWVDTLTKTGRAGHGTLALDDETVRLLRELRRQQEELAVQCGTALVPDAFVFRLDTVIDGSVAMHPDTMSSRMRELCRAVPGAQHVTLKSLRTFVASELDLAGGGIDDVQAILRHKPGSPVTLRHYRVARAERTRRLTTGLGDLLNGDADAHSSATDGDSTAGTTEAAEGA